MAFLLQQWLSNKLKPGLTNMGSRFSINLILQKKISATSDLSEGLNKPMKQIQLQTTDGIV